MEQSAYLHLVKRWFWTLLLAAWVAGLVGYVTASFIPPVYGAETRLLVGPVNADEPTVEGAVRLAPTYAELATTEERLRRVIDAVGLEMTPSELEESVSVVANTTTRIITVDSSHSDAATAAAIANTISEELISLTTRTVQRPEGQLTVIDPAVAPTASSGTSASLIAFLAGAAGLLIAGLLVAVLEYLSHTVKTKHDLAAVAGVPVLGEINIAHGYVGTPLQPLVVEGNPGSRTALGYRTLATRLPLGEPEDADRVHSLVVVGSQRGEGAGEFAANLAAVIARSGRTVTLIDADELDHQISRMYMLDDRAGLGELLALDSRVLPTTDSIDRVRIRRGPDVGIIPAGNHVTPDVPEEHAERLLACVAESSDLVLVSGAPMDQSATAVAWARLADAAIVVARADVTRVENLQVAIESLGMVEARVVGSVLLERQRRERRGITRRSMAPQTQSGRHTVGDKSPS